MKISSLAIIVVLVVAVMLVGLAGCTQKQLNPDTKIEENTFSSGLKVGVISDTQLPDKTKEEVKAKEEKYLVNLEKALKVLKYQKVNMIIFAGDIGDIATDNTYALFNGAIDSVFGDNKPVFQIIMGNHDYWGDATKTTTYYQELFETKIGASPWTHKKVNGYHFIGVSPSRGNTKDGYGAILKWTEERIKIASAETPDKPIFVTTHNSPLNTVYGSDEWGDKQLNKIFKKYPNVVNISGHTHYSILDERSIYQGDYTVLNTQSLSYTELESGKENGSIPPNADATPMGYIMDLQDTKVEISRWEFTNGSIGTEVKNENRWTLNVPYNKETFKYTRELRIEKNRSPVFDAPLEGKIATTTDGVQVSFKAGKDDDFVYSYKVVINDRITKYYFSDFYNGLTRMKEEVSLNIKYKSTSINNIKIYAVDSYGKTSVQCIVLKLM